MYIIGLMLKKVEFVRGYIIRLLYICFRKVKRFTPESKHYTTSKD